MAKNLLFEEEDKQEKEVKQEEEVKQELKKIMGIIEDINQWLDQMEDEQEGEDVKELKNKIREQIKNIKHLFDKRGNLQELKNKIMELFENTMSLLKKLDDEREREFFQEGEHLQPLLTRLGEPKRLEDEKIRLIVNYK